MIAMPAGCGSPGARIAWIRLPSTVTTAPATTPTDAAAGADTARYMLQVGSFRKLDDADRLKARLAFLGRPVLFKPSAKAIIREYKRGSKDAPQGYEAAIPWEQNWLKEALRKADADLDKVAPATPAAQKLAGHDQDRTARVLRHE